MSQSPFALALWPRSFSRIDLLLVRLFVRELRKERRKIILTIAGIAWGTLTIILLLSFGQGLASLCLKLQEMKSGLDALKR